MPKATNAQAALSGLVQSFVSDVLTLLQRTAIAEAGNLRAPQARGKGRAAAGPRAAKGADKRGTGKPGRPPKLPESERQKLVTKALRLIARTEGGTTMKAVQDALGTDADTTKRLLRGLVRAQAVRTTGRTRGMTYHPLAPAAEPAA